MFGFLFSVAVGSNFRTLQAHYKRHLTVPTWCSSPWGGGGADGGGLHRQLLPGSATIRVPVEAHTEVLYAPVTPTPSLLLRLSSLPLLRLSSSPLFLRLSSPPWRKSRRPILPSALLEHEPTILAPAAPTPRPGDPLTYAPATHPTPHPNH